MANVQKLKEERVDLEKKIQDKQKELDDFMAGFSSDQSKWTDESNTKAVGLEKELKGLKTDLSTKDSEISKQENFERLTSERLDRERAQDKNYTAANRQSEEQKAYQSFSFHKAFGNIQDQKVHGGAEADVIGEGQRIAKEKGWGDTGYNHITLPPGMNEYRSEKQIAAEKAMSVGTATTGGAGVATTTMPLVPVLRPRLKVVEAGTNVRSGMVNNLSFYRHTTVETASMNSEIGAGNEVTPTFDTFAAAPHRIECYTTISKQLMIQNPEVGEPWIRQNLEFAQQKKLDQQVLAGLGTGNEIEGIENISGIGSVGWDALDPYASFIGLETAIAVDNADVDNMKYMITPGLRGTLKTTRIDPGSGIMVWNSLPYAALVSTQVPINTTPDPDEHYVYFGNWGDGSIFLWGVTDIVVDPYSLRRTAQIEIVVNIWGDYAVNHPESFALMTDALI